MMRFAKHTLRAVVCAGILALAAGTAEAAVRTISFWPADLQPSAAPSGYTQMPGYVSSSYTDNGTDRGVTFYKQLKLPIGSRLRAVTLLYATNTSCGAAINYNGEINRYKYGGPMVQMLSYGGSAITSNAVWEHTSTDPIPLDPRDLVVKRGYRYYVEVYSQNACTKIHGVRVRYTTP